MDKIDQKPKPPKPFLIGKELKTTDLRHSAVWRASGSQPKPKPKRCIGFGQGVNQAAGAAPTLRSALWVSSGGSASPAGSERSNHSPQKQSIPASSSSSRES